MEFLTKHKRNQKTNKKLAEKGITLIALVITIIVLLILAGVSISAITGNESAMSKAKQAKTANENADELDTIKLACVEAVARGTTGYIDENVLEEKLNRIATFTKETDAKGIYYKVTGIKSKIVYKVRPNGSIETMSGVNLTIPNNKTEIVFVKGVANQSEQLSASLTEDLQYSGKTITWSSSNTNVATVDQTGKVEIAENAQAGTSTITASAGVGTDGTCNVRVVNSIDDAIINNTAIATLVTSGMEAEDNTDVNLTPSNNVEDITYSIVSGDASLTATTGTIHINKITTTAATVKVKLTGNMTNKEKQITINVTKQVEDIEKLTLGTYVTYTAKNPNYDANVEGSTETIPIPCQVLYNDSTNGLQLVSVNPVRDVTLGIGDSKYTTGTDLEKAQNSYNNAIENLNDIAEGYQNTSDCGLTLDARCVGSLPTLNTNKNAFSEKDDAITGTTRTYQVYQNNYYATDYNVVNSSDTPIRDLAQLNTIGAKGFSKKADGTDAKNFYDRYWLASRYVRFNSNDKYFNVRDVNCGGGLNYSQLWFINSSARTGASKPGAGFRPVFLLTSNIKVESGKGTLGEAYVLKAK